MRFMSSKTCRILACLCLMATVVVFTHVSSADNLNSNAKVKNVILLISDGAGFNTWTATDYYQYGQTGTQVYEHFPTQVAMNTSNVDFGYDPNEAWTMFTYGGYGNVTDSASAATAMATGVKTDNYSIGVDVNDDPQMNVVEYAESLGKATGVVTSVQFSHATPGSFVAHNFSRNNYADIANEMLDSDVDVIMGCGAPDYDDNGDPIDPPFNYTYVGGEATWDGLVAGTLADWTLIRSRAEFQALAEGPTPVRVVGVPQVKSNLQYYRTPGSAPYFPFNVPLTETVPTLEEMTKAALNVLDNDENGFFLMVEGGSVDWANHEAGYGWMGSDFTSNAKVRMIEEQIDFNKTVEAVVEWVKKNSNWGETMIIVTADHETGNLWGPDSGTDPDTGEPIFNPVVNNGAGEVPGMMHYNWYHTRHLVPLFAKGSAARLFKGHADEMDMVRGRYIDNTEIFDTIVKALK